MSWLESLEYEHNFECEKCGNTGYLMSHLKPEDPTCESCHEGTMTYMGFTPIKMGGSTKVEYEKNGVKAWRVQDSNGNVRHVSKMAETYYNTAKMQGEYSRAFTDQVKEGTATEFRKFQKKLESDAKVSTVSKGEVG